MKLLNSKGMLQKNGVFLGYFIESDDFVNQDIIVLQPECLV